MAKFVPDVKTQRWIVIAPSRVSRPDEFYKEKKSHVCPFCPGNENLSPFEIMRLGEGEKNSTGWRVRVVANKYPITDFHEVIIHSAQHEKDIEDFTAEQIVDILKVYKTRFTVHEENGQVMIFSNHGEHAGASLTHPHSQLVVIPRQINLDALVREPVMNIVEDNTYFVTYCPDFSQWPYEIWIAPKKTGTVFREIEESQINDLAPLLQKGIRRLREKYAEIARERNSSLPFAYNYYIHHAKDWFIRIIPRLIHRAGFELGTGLSVNVVDPTLAAVQLREINI